MKIHLPKSFKNKELVAGTVVGLSLLLGGFIWFFAIRTSPESLLHEALSKEAPDPIGATQRIYDYGVSALSESTASKDGKTSKSESSVECISDSGIGEIQVAFNTRQIQEQIFFQYTKVNLSSGDEATDQEFNDFYKNSVINKWSLLSVPNTAALAHKEKGVSFNLLGAVSKKLTAKEIAAKLKEHQTITIISSRDIKHYAKPAIEYTLLARRSAYKRFMDSVEPQFKYSEEILDQLFADDTEEITLIVRKDDKSIVSAKSTSPNICLPVLAQLDEGAVAFTSHTVEVETKFNSRPSTNVRNLIKPTEYLNQEEFNALFSE